MDAKAPTTQHVPIVSYILVSEFDILKGSTLRASYPNSIPNYENNFFSNLMLPEGAHHHEEDTTVFFLNRTGPRHATTMPFPTGTNQPTNTPHNSATVPSMTPSTQRKVRGLLLKYDTAAADWIQDNDADQTTGSNKDTSSSGVTSWCTFKIEPSSLPNNAKFHHLVVSNSNGTETKRIVVHETLQYSRLSHNFSSIYDTKDRAIGLLFKSSSDLSHFEQALRTIHADGIDNIPVDDESKLNSDNNSDNSESDEEKEEEEEEEEEEGEGKENTGAQKSSVKTGEKSTPLAPTAKEAPFLYCYNLVRTKKDSSVDRGAVVKAIALCSPYPFIHCMQRLLTCCLDAVYEHQQHNKTTHRSGATSSEDSYMTLLSSLFTSINRAVLLPQMPPRSPHYRSLLRSSMVPNGMGSRQQSLNLLPPSCGSTNSGPQNSCLGAPQTTIRVTLGLHGANCVPLVLPRYLEVDMVGNSQLIPLLTLFRQDVVHIIDAVLHNRRVLFVGHMSSMLSSDVCNAVLATCTLFSPPFVSMLTKCYPYANLTDLSFLEAPNGYVAGVTNPMFKSKETWWDLMCDMETGKCIHSPHSPVHGSGGGSGGGGSGSSLISRTTTADVNVYMNPINNEEAIKRHRVVVADVVEAVDAGKQ